MLSLMLLTSCVSSKVCRFRVAEARFKQTSICLQGQKSTEIFYQSEHDVLKARIGELERELEDKTQRLRRFNQLGLFDVDKEGRLRSHE